MSVCDCKNWRVVTWPAGKLPVYRCSKCKEVSPVKEGQWLQDILMANYLKFVQEQNK